MLQSGKPFRFWSVWIGLQFRKWRDAGSKFIVGSIISKCGTIPEWRNVRTLSSGCLFLLFRLIAISSLNWTVCPASHTYLKSERCLTHPASQTFCTFFDGSIISKCGTISGRRNVGMLSRARTWRLVHRNRQCQHTSCSKNHARSLLPSRTLLLIRMCARLEHTCWHV